MSLWHKSVREITFTDVDHFCNSGLPESARLDYKLNFPSNLEKTIAAFANTLGGDILLGVDSDPKTNQPIWPPISALRLDAGLQERVYQKATEAIYPPVRVNLSSVMEVPSLPGHCIVVIRVDESKDAPHAVAKGREIYVYERSDNKTDPIKLAHIERIEYLLKRRKRIEEEREEVRSEAIKRAKPLIAPALRPVIWASVIPLYPWRSLCKPSACHSFLRQIRPYNDIQRIPDGAMYISQERIVRFEGFLTADTITCDTRGNFLYLRGIVGLNRGHIPDIALVVKEAELEEKIYPMASIRQRFESMLDVAREFYRKAIAERPGLLSIKIGMEKVKGARIYQPDAIDQSKLFLDDNYRDEIILTEDEFLSTSGGTQLLYDRIAYAFDVMTPDGQ